MLFVSWDNQIPEKMITLDLTFTAQQTSIEYIITNKLNGSTQEIPQVDHSLKSKNDYKKTCIYIN